MLEFGDDLPQLALGRDPQRCAIVFPAEDVHVGREHCALRRELGRYRLVLNKAHLVLVNGQPAIDDQELDQTADLQLGRDGPKLVVETCGSPALPATQSDGHPQIGKTTMLRDAETRAQRSTLLALGVLVALLAAAGTVYWLWGRQQQTNQATRTAVTKAFEEVGRKVRKVDERVGQADQKAGQFDREIGKVKAHLDRVQVQLVDEKQLTKTQIGALNELKSKFVRVEQDLSQSGRKLNEALRQAVPSVYLVLTRDPAKHEKAVATCWVVDQQRGIVATNAHVAEEFDNLAEQHSMIIRSSGNPPQDFEIKSVRVHPGFGQFCDLWDQYAPAVRTGIDELESIRAAGGGCDAALMFVEHPQGLGPALRLASDATLQGLKECDPIGYVGFPVENLVLGGTNPKMPTPTLHHAYVTALTDYFGISKTDWTERQLIQHSLPTTGGASGSPLILASGDVVGLNSAGNIIRILQREGQGTLRFSRIATGAQINFGQRVDLLRELLSGTEQSAQAKRLQRWKEQLARYFSHRREVVAQICLDCLDREVSAWAKALTQGGEFAVTDTQVTHVKGSVSKENAEGKTHRLTTPGSGPAAFIAVAKDFAPIELAVYEINDGKRGRLHRSTGDQEWLWAVRSDVRAGQTFEAVVSSPATTPADYDIYLYQAKQKRTPLETRRDAVVQELQRYFRQKSSSAFEFHLEKQGQAKLAENKSADPKAVSLLTRDIPSGGRYLIIAVSDGGERIGLAISRVKDGKEKAVATDYGPSSWAAIGIEVESPEKLLAVVSGPTKGIRFGWYVYRARP